MNFSTKKITYEDRTQKGKDKGKDYIIRPFPYGQLKTLGTVVPGEFEMNIYDYM